MKVPHYKYEDNKLWYRRQEGSDQYVQVPPKSDRYNLIEVEHKLGHFQVDSVHTSLTKEFYWPKMSRDIEHLINNCSVSNRHKKVPLIQHLALAIHPVGIFDRSTWITGNS